MSFLKKLFIVYVLLTLTGCVQSYRFAVNSINSGYDISKTRYWLLSSNRNVKTSDLQFQEYARYVKKALSMRGHVEASNIAQADIVIGLIYGMGQPTTKTRTVTVPQYGMKGGDVKSFNISSYGTNGYSTTSGTITSERTFGLTGHSTQIRTETIHSRYLIIEAYDNDFEDKKEFKPLWKTSVIETIASGSMRDAFPTLVASIVPFLGTDTKSTINVSSYDFDKRTKQIQGNY